MEIELEYNDELNCHEFVFQEPSNMFTGKIKIEFPDGVTEGHLLRLCDYSSYKACIIINTERETYNQYIDYSFAESMTNKKVKYRDNYIKFNVYYNVTDINFGAPCNIRATLPKDLKTTIYLKSSPTISCRNFGMGRIISDNTVNLHDMQCIAFITPKSNVLQSIEVECNGITKVINAHEMVCQDMKYLNVYVCNQFDSEKSVTLKKMYKYNKSTDFITPVTFNRFTFEDSANECVIYIKMNID
jgi:hypothetical protein